MGLCHGTAAAINADQQSTPTRSNPRRGSHPTERLPSERPAGSMSSPPKSPRHSSGDSIASSHRSKSKNRPLRSPSSAAATSTAIITTPGRSLLDGVVDPADIISVLDERVDQVVNQFTSAELLQIQRHMRSITRAIRDMPASTTAAALMTMGRGSTSASLLPNTKAALSKQCMDEAVLRRIFAAGAEQFQRGSEEWSKWKKKRYVPSINNTSNKNIMADTELISAESSRQDNSSSDPGVVKAVMTPATSSTSSQPYPSGKYKVDPVGSIYILLLACSEARWESYAAASAAIAARTVTAAEDGVASNHSTGGSSVQDTKQRRSNSGLVPFRNGNSDIGNNDEGALTVNNFPLPVGISFLMFCYLMAIATKSTNRDQKLLLLFHIFVPPKQLKSILLQQQPNSVFPSYMFEIGFMPQHKEKFLSVTSREVHPSNLGLRVSAAVVRDTIASLLLVSMYRRHGTEGAEPHPVSNGDVDIMESIPELVALYDSCTENRLWSYDDFIAWANGGGLDDAMTDSVLQTLFSTGIIISAEQELHMVRERWLEWQNEEYERRSSPVQTSSGGTSSKSEVENGSKKRFPGIWGLVNGVGVDPTPTAANDNDDVALNMTYEKAGRVWGGIGNIDGLGGLGNGVLYCIDTHWWESWEKYSGWSWDSGNDFSLGDIDRPRQRVRQRRPGALSTECLLQKNGDFVGGALGSYEVMKSKLHRCLDYVVVPPAVWDILFEIYGGGPPLPRMIEIPMDSERASQNYVASIDRNRVVPIPESLKVVTHPWILHCQVCDPHQPYRRGDVGSSTIRVMVTPDQPFWRFFAEIVLRLPVSHSRAGDVSGKGNARMWRKLESSTLGGEHSDATGACRYGPWTLLCKGRSTEFPVDLKTFEETEFHSHYRNSWLQYADHGTVESVGLSDGTHVMFEYALVGKDGAFSWPREAAAKAGRARRLAEEDYLFRLKLRGVDAHGYPTNEDIVGTAVDAMDSTGRWYQAEIVEVERNNQKGANNESFSQEENSEYFESDEDAEKPAKKGIAGNRRVRVDFGEAAFHEEWIDANSDRVACLGRFTLDGIKSLESPDASGLEAKSLNNFCRKIGGSSSDSSAFENAAVCSFPGYGACGLVNLGNTCYMSVALQCVSYMPFIRAYLLSGLYKANGDLNRENPLGTGGKLLEELSELMRQMWSGRYGARSPTRFRAQLAKARSQFCGTEQQDAQELLNTLIDSLHEDSNKIKNKPLVPPLDDAWVKKMDLSRVGLEAWRRFLRRNRSVITNTAMGQVLNRVVCPVCRHSSLNFDPFNMLSIPFPTVTDVVFRCTLVRRGTALNCPTLCRCKNSMHLSLSGTAPSTEEQSIVEVFTVIVPRLADISDLKHRLEKVSGVAADRLRLWKAEKFELSPRISRKVPTDTKLVKISTLPNKEGPCVQLTKQSEKDEGLSTSITNIFAFEATLNPRPIQASERYSNNGADEEKGDEETVSSDDGEQSQFSYHESIQEELARYGDSLECAMFDSDPTSIARAVSRSLWPKDGSEFKLGLRVDAIDQRGHWFPGSVVEISDSNQHDETPGNRDGVSRKVRLHFDNFSSKWDEWYDFTDFSNGQVRPLYSHSTPRMKPTEVIVYHRLGIGANKKSNEVSSSEPDSALFGQSFCIQFLNEWSTARAGAHILAQAARFLRSAKMPSTATSLARKLTGSDSANENDKLDDASEMACAAVAEAIDVLVESELIYIKRALSQDNSEGKAFDAAAMTYSLSDKLVSLLPRLPFDVRVCSVDSLTGKAGGDAEETSFPFSLVRTVGNYLNTGNAIVLHWRNVRLDKRMKKSSTRVSENSPEHSDGGFVAYKNPVVRIHSDASLNREAGSLKHSGDDKAESSEISVTMNIGICLTEFCKEQKLALADCWYCPKCKDLREGLQSMSLWRLPDILTLHIKRFNCSARWREKISTKINFPLTGLDLSKWCDKESLAQMNASGPTEETVLYDLIGVVNHMGGMTGGHYVATCKATPCSVDGSEELAHNFNGAGSNGFAVISPEIFLDQSVWRLPGLGKDKEGSNLIQQSRAAANACARVVSESSEPLWLHFDDDLVEPIPPEAVVSEMAYVLFYRRRQLTPSNIARYSTID